MENLENKSNTDLMRIRKELREEFERFRHEVVRVYDHWKSLESEYIKVNNELNKRSGG